MLLADVPVTNMPIPSRYSGGQGHPLLINKLAMDVQYPENTTKLTEVVDSMGNTWYLVAEGYEFGNFFIDPDRVPVGRNDPFTKLWYDGANLSARQKFAKLNDDIYRANNWSNSEFRNADEWHTYDFTYGQPIVVKQDYPLSYYHLTYPYVITRDGKSWYGLENPAAHNPVDDNRDLITGVRSVLPLRLISQLSSVYSAAAAFGPQLHLTTNDGNDPSWVLTVNRWTKTAYLAGTNIVTMPSAFLNSLAITRGFQDFKFTFDAVSAIVQLVSATVKAGTNVAGVQDFIKGLKNTGSAVNLTNRSKPANEAGQQSEGEIPIWPFAAAAAALTLAYLLS